MSAKDHLKRIHGLHCVVCLFWKDIYRHAEEAHHLEFVRGDHSDYATVPLCIGCHSALHSNRRRLFYGQHKGMSDVSLLAYTIKMLMELE